MRRRRPRRWVVIPQWERFQHYGDRRPVWVKDYTEQLDNEDYLELPVEARGLLHDLRLLYAKRKGQVPNSPETLTVLLGFKVTQRDLNRLSKAGFLDIVASKPASPVASSDARDSTRSRDVDKDEREPKGSLSQEDASGRAKKGPPPRPERARDNGRPALYKRAEMWVETVGAREVPVDAFPRVLREEFPKLNAEQLHALEAKAAEARVEEDIRF